MLPSARGAQAVPRASMCYRRSRPRDEASRRQLRHRTCPDDVRGSLPRKAIGLVSTGRSGAQLNRVALRRQGVNELLDPFGPHSLGGRRDCRAVRSQDGFARAGGSQPQIVPGLGSSGPNDSFGAAKSKLRLSAQGRKRQFVNSACSRSAASHSIRSFAPSSERCRPAVTSRPNRRRCLLCAQGCSVILRNPCAVIGRSLHAVPLVRTPP